MHFRRSIIIPLFISALIAVSCNTSRADVLDEIANALRSGNSKEVARYFSSRVELKIDANDNIYSNTQAEMILRDFFSKNPPSSFTLVHKGASAKGQTYMIGDLVTSSGTYRTNVLLKQEGSSFFIQEIQFEKK